MTRMSTKTWSALALTAMMSTGLAFSATNAMAAEAPSTTFQISSASDSNIRAGAQAFKRGEFKESAMFNRVALKSSLSKKRRAIAHSNLCAAYGAMGDYEQAKLSCDASLELRPGYEAAVKNKSALTIKLAQNTK